MGKLACDLGNVYQCLPLVSNSSRLFGFLVNAKAEAPTDVDQKHLEATLAAIDAAMAPLHAARMAREDAQLIRDEFANTAAMMRHAARRGLWQLGSKRYQVIELTAELRHMIGQHETLWLARNRPGGLVDSAGRLRKTLDLYSRK